MEAAADVVVLRRPNSGDASLCPDAAVTLGLLALMPAGVETLVPAVVAVLGLSMLDGAANRGADVLTTGLGLVVLGPVAGLPVLGQLVVVAVPSPVVGVLILGPADGVPVLGSLAAIALLGPDVGVTALGPVAGVPMPVPAGEAENLDPVIAVVVRWPCPAKLTEAVDDEAAED